MINDYQNWTGSRPELISLIKLLEKENPKLYKFFSKQLGRYSSVNERRIQQFIDEGIIQKPVFENKKYLYNFEHLVRYLSAIILRNKGYPVKIIKQSLDISGFDFTRIRTAYNQRKMDSYTFFRNRYNHFTIHSNTT